MLALVCTLVLVTSSAQAKEISFKVTGTVTGVGVPGQGHVEIGDTVTFCYTFESTTEAITQSGVQNYYDALIAASLEAGSLNLSETVSPTGRINVRDGVETRAITTPDEYVVSAGRLSGSGFLRVGVTVRLRDFSRTAFSNDDLPTAPLDVAAFADVAELIVRAGRRILLRATVDSIEFCGDTTPPTVDCSLATNSLWPANHKLVDVGLDYLVTDDQDSNPTVEVLVFSDEAEEADGDGNTEYDAIDDGESLWLRAERSGNGDGRVYLIVVIATDASGNVGFDCCTVTVPHNKSKASRNDADDQAIAAEAECLIDGAAPVGFFSLID